MIWLIIGLSLKISNIRTAPVSVSHPKHQVLHSLKRVLSFYCVTPRAFASPLF